MESDCYKYVKKSHKFHIHADKIHVPPMLLNVISSPWPFSKWGIDMIGMIEPKASNGHCLILVAINYFTKWVEAASYTNLTRQVVVIFIKNNLICRYGIPNRIIIDNGSNLNNKMVKELCGEFKIEHHKSSHYRPKMNGAVEAANKNIKKIVKKMVVTCKTSMKCSLLLCIGTALQFALQLGQHFYPRYMAWNLCSQSRLKFPP
ncbi:uncharacterized protein LOC131659336 [Vicia villosa]|uniref:uncharacterized protein LOC131659336 n=1 Tax=Vicia villosa TaxID=3911 RepID=UPI00273CD105|nr:uncharacterized protein LOC131659336 [Vicia villosa]